MLILTRRNQEAIIIGDNIRVMVLGINGNQAKIGIAAPDDVVILREELKGIPHNKPQIINKKKRRIINLPIEENK